MPFARRSSSNAPADILRHSPPGYQIAATVRF